MQLPIGVADEFEGVVDLVTMKAIRWDDKTLGMRVIESEIPAALVAQAREYRAKLVEAAAEGDERLLEKFVERGELSVDEIRAGLRARCLRGEIVPVLCGSAFRNKGVQALLDAVVFYLPAPADRARRQGVLPGGGEGARSPERQSAVRGVRVQDRDRCGRQPDVLPRLFGRPALGRRRLRAAA